ncbi:MAG: tyrosine--tRNA ligase [Methanobacteriaceae archaeon]|jgi:tyrosyl-tRNA synthetase|nr:tyrosine--tRNA ligase [Candidatus Methanorudis spinitermitis]
MDKKVKVEIIRKKTLEVINTEELDKKLEKKSPIVYTGYEPSGKIHLGHAITIIKLKQLQEIGFKIKILLADYHAYLNGKGTIEEIEEMAEYNKKCFLAFGLSKENTEFILGSSFQTSHDYVKDLYKLANLTTLSRSKRSMDQVSRSSKNPKVANVLYPLMQVVDMKFLNVDVALGGMEQRKIQMLAREHLPKLDFEVPVCIHTPLLHGLDGDEKMSSSKGNLIAIDDTEGEIVEKIKKSYCPLKEAEGNPIIEIASHFIFSNQDEIIIERDEKFGGNLNLSETELIDMYTSGELHPADLKSAVSKFMIEYLKSVREYMLNNQ